MYFFMNYVENCGYATILNQRLKIDNQSEILFSETITDTNETSKS